MMITQKPWDDAFLSHKPTSIGSSSRSSVSRTRGCLLKRSSFRMTTAKLKSEYHKRQRGEGKG